MRVTVLDTAQEAAAAAAVALAAQLRRKPGSVLGLATGRTSLALYAELVRLHRAGAVDFSRARTLNLDEFAGLGARDEGSYCAFMRAHFFSRVNLGRGRMHFLRGDAPDLAAECDRYEQLIRAIGGIDLQWLGLGANGHIGFNEPATRLHARTHVARLAPGTRRANAALFAGRLDRVPRAALSMGMSTILGARAILLVATGRSKAGAVAAMLSGAIATACPASFLQLHPNVQVLVDRAAAAGLPRPGSRSPAAPSRPPHEGAAARRRTRDRSSA